MCVWLRNPRDTQGMYVDEDGVGEGHSGIHLFVCHKGNGNGKGLSQEWPDGSFLFTGICMCVCMYPLIRLVVEFVIFVAGPFAESTYA